MIDCGVAMYQQVAEGNDLREVRNAGGQNRIAFRQLVERLADDLELSFDRRVEQGIRGVVVRADPGDEGLDRANGLTGIPEEGPSVTPDRRDPLRG